MWEKKVTKTLFTLNIDMKFAPEIVKLTYPLLEHFAKKINADFVIIKERKFPEWPITYEKFQVYELSQKIGSDWNWFLDSDALVHPEMPDITGYLNKNTVAHNGVDQASIRWSPKDRFFLRDGRDIGSANWCAIASDWCIELWKPLDDLTFEEALRFIHPTVNETNTVVDANHLIDDFVASRNIAKYGLKLTTINKIFQDFHYPENQCYFVHDYTLNHPDKVAKLKKTLQEWKLPNKVIQPSLYS